MSHALSMPSVDSIGLFGTFAALLFLVAWPSKRAQCEIGLIPLHQERCNGSQRFAIFIYSGNIYNWRISLYDDFLVVASIRTMVFRYRDIDFVEYKRSWVSKGIQFHVRDSRVEFFVFPKNAESMLTLLEKKGVSVLRPG